MEFFRSVGDYLLKVEEGSQEWHWYVRNVGSEDRRTLVDMGSKPDEKAAKLAARRAMEKHRRSER